MEILEVIKDYSITVEAYDEGFGALPQPASAPLEDESFYRDTSISNELKYELLQELDAIRSGFLKPTPAEGEAVDVGIDCEYQRVPNGQYNHVLSYQAVVRKGGKMLKVVAYPKNKKKGGRFTFKRFMGFVLEQAIEHRVITDFPQQLNVFGHFLRADLPCFRDYYSNKRGFDVIGGTLISNEKRYGIDWAAENCRRPSSERFVVTDRHRKPRSIQTRFIDTMLLTPGRSGLAVVGQMLGLPKLELPEGYTINEMERLLSERKKEFEAYGLRDAEIAVIYGQMMAQFAKELNLPYNRLPPTIGAIAVHVLRQTIDSKDDFNRLFGVSFETQHYYNEDNDRTQTRTIKKESIYRRYRSQAASDVYSGGRNEAYMMGLLSLGLYNDWDLRGAYTTGLTSIYELDYKFAYDCTDPAEYCGHVCGLACVQFKFPEDTRYPSLLVRGPYGLCYPLEGVSYCTGPEIEVALNQGAKIEILHGFIVPWVEREKSVFSPFVKEVRDQRAFYKAKGDEFHEKLWKEIGNSAYGKIAQTVKEKTVFDAETGLSKPLSPSALTNPYMAAFVTGFVRACISEMLASIPDHRNVVSVTTDGFLTDAAREEINTSGPICTMYQSLCDALGDDADMLEKKGSLFQGVCPKTRGLFTTVADPASQKLILAKAGVKPEERYKTVEEQNQYMLDIYFNRDHTSTVPNSHLVSARQMLEDEMDLVTIDRSDKRLSLEYDMKRRLVNPRMEAWQNSEGEVYEHLLCDSVPWQTAELSQKVRAYFDEWRRNNCLKTVDDFDRFEDFWKCKLSTEGVRVNVTAEGSIGLLRRCFLGAVTKGVWGLELSGTRQELVEWLTTQGYQTSISDVKEAKRRKLYSRVVPVTKAVVKLLKVILSEYPDFQYLEMFKYEYHDELEMLMQAE